MSSGSLKFCVLFIAAACACMLAVEARPLDGMSDFDREAFLGRWFEVGCSLDYMYNHVPVVITGLLDQMRSLQYYGTDDNSTCHTIDCKQEDLRTTFLAKMTSI